MTASTSSAVSGTGTVTAWTRMATPAEMLNKFEAAVSQILAMKTAHQLPGDAEPGA